MTQRKVIGRLIVLVCMVAGGLAASTERASAITDTFGVGTHTFIVPSGVTSIAVDASGAQGAMGGGEPDYLPGGAGGLGGRVQVSIGVTPGEQLQVNVGGSGSNTTAPGFNGGGAGGGEGSDQEGGRGGGASDLRKPPYTAADRLVVAGGGGGGGGGPSFPCTTAASAGDGGVEPSSGEDGFAGVPFCRRIIASGGEGGASGGPAGGPGAQGGGGGGGGGADGGAGGGGGIRQGGGAGGGGGASAAPGPGIVGSPTFTDYTNSGDGVVTITYEGPASSTFVFSGFKAPIDNDSVNTANAGRSIPVKWHLENADGTPVDDPSSFVSLTSQSGTGDCAGPPSDAVETAAGRSGLKYIGDGDWRFNWKTPKSYAGQCRTMTLTLSDDSTYTAAFQFE